MQVANDAEFSGTNAIVEYKYKKHITKNNISI
jgi:hypothetical protein